mmetsp:Transcript_9052/g.9098  ORF Transcript_9052/g.9098 Transcript_9052/m.9098 type:complete len:388 (+) Transcript_9052:239-1402(+)
MVNKRFFKSIFDLFQRYPISMNGVTGGLIFVAGEITNQISMNSTSRPIFKDMHSAKQFACTCDWHFKHIEWRRMESLAALGFFENGLFTLAWFRFLNQYVGKGHGTTLVLTKCLYDQVFFATQEDLLFIGMCVWSDPSLFPVAMAEVKRSFLPTWLLDCWMWPVLNFISYAWVPVYLQPTYTAMVQFTWQLYVALVASRDHDDDVLHALFCAIDTDHSGYIEEHELEGELTLRGLQLSKSQLLDIILEVDEDNDGRIDFDEFKHAVKSGTCRKTDLWARLSNDVGLQYGASAAIKRMKNLEKQQEAAPEIQTETPHHHESPSEIATSPLSDSVPTPSYDLPSVPISYVKDMEEEDHNNKMLHAMRMAAEGITAVSFLAIFRRFVFKI